MFFHGFIAHAFDSSDLGIAEIFEPVHQEYIPCDWIQSGDGFLGAAKHVAVLQRRMRVGARNVMILEAVVSLQLAAHPRPLPVFQDRSGCRREIGCRGFEEGCAHALRGKEAAKRLLHEVADFMRRNVAAEDACYAGLMCDVQRLGAIGMVEPRPVVWRQGVARCGTSPVRRVVIIVHSISPTGRTVRR